MANQSLCNFGYSLIKKDIKRLKKYTSLVDDLEKLFIIINKPWVEHRVIIDENRRIYQDGENISCYKRRGPVTSHGLSPRNGIRLIYAIVKGVRFVPLLVFAAAEEPKYPLRICKAIIKNRVRTLKLKTILVDAINAFVIKSEGIFKEMYDLLEAFPNRKIILTGADDKQMEEYGLNNMPYDVFTLKHNPEKTVPIYYKKVLEHFGLSRGDVVCFEHNKHAVKSALSVGITTYYYDSDKGDLKSLKRFLDKEL